MLNKKDVPLLSIVEFRINLKSQNFSFSYIVFNKKSTIENSHKNDEIMGKTRSSNILLQS